MQFNYQAKDRAGKLRAGIVVSDDQSHAEQLLSENGLVILSLEEQEPTLLDKLWPFGKKVPGKQLVLFSRQLSTLIGAQVPILQSLRILQAQMENKRLQTILAETVASVESGDSLSLSLSRYPMVFDTVYINIVHSGELSGSMDRSLNYLADQLEKNYDLNSKVRGAMTYPIFVVSAVILIGSFMFLFVMPSLVTSLTEQGNSLPLLTVWLISFTTFFGHFWWAFLIALIVLFFGFRYALTTIAGRYYFDRFKISAPILGPIFTKIYLARFSRNLSTLIIGGIPIIRSLQTVAELVNNVIYKQLILDAGNKLAAGKGIAESFAGHKEMPPIVTQMIEVGERSATLSAILGKLADYYEKEVDQTIGSLASLIEPVIILILGAAVGILVAGVLLPIYNIGSSSS
jgi:type IV pilus assembly protein PilC